MSSGQQWQGLASISQQWQGTASSAQQWQGSAGSGSPGGGSLQAVVKAGQPWQSSPGRWQCDVNITIVNRGMLAVLQHASVHSADHAHVSSADYISFWYNEDQNDARYKADTC